MVHKFQVFIYWPELIESPRSYKIGDNKRNKQLKRIKHHTASQLHSLHEMILQELHHAEGPEPLDTEDLQ